MAIPASRDGHVETYDEIVLEQLDDLQTVLVVAGNECNCAGFAKPDERIFPTVGPRDRLMKLGERDTIGFVMLSPESRVHVNWGDDQGTCVPVSETNIGVFWEKLKAFFHNAGRYQVDAWMVLDTVDAQHIPFGAKVV